jgi:hypothetical protein
MQYMFLIYTDETQDPALSAPDRDAVMAEYYAFAKETTERKMMVAGDEIQPSHTATTVRLRQGQRTHTPGPFAQGKEQLGGFFILDCKNLDEALDMAAKIPGARYGAVEVRGIVSGNGS